MAAHSSVLIWRIPWTEESGGLQCRGSQSQTRLKQLSTHSVFLLILDVFAFFFFHLCSEKLPVVPAFFYVYCFLLLLLPVTTAIISASFFTKATLDNSLQSQTKKCLCLGSLLTSFRHNTASAAKTRHPHTEFTCLYRCCKNGRKDSFKERKRRLIYKMKVICMCRFILAFSLKDVS